jgi:hypothetical protein
MFAAILSFMDWAFPPRVRMAAVSLFNIANTDRFYENYGKGFRGRLLIVLALAATLATVMQLQVDIAFQGSVIVLAFAAYMILLAYTMWKAERQANSSSPQ